MNTTTTTTEKKHGPFECAITRIGGGDKLHPVIRFVGETEWYFQCRCGGTSNGSAAKRMQIFRGVKHTCRT